MKVSRRVRQLLRKGHKPKELIELGFPKSIVTRAYRQLHKEKIKGKLQKSMALRIAALYAYIEI